MLNIQDLLFYKTWYPIVPLIEWGHFLPHIPIAKKIWKGLRVKINPYI